MSSHHDRNCHCNHCSTKPSKRPKRQLSPCEEQTTVKVLKISASDVFPCLTYPVRIVTTIAKNIMPTIRIERTTGSCPPHYERGWEYAESRNDRLVMVRNKKDGFRLHRGGWKKTKPREKVVNKYYLVERENEAVRHRPRNPSGPRDRDGKVYIDVLQEQREAAAIAARPKIEVRRPVHAIPSCPDDNDSPARGRPRRRFFIDEADLPGSRERDRGQLVRKIPLQRARPLDIVERGQRHRRECDPRYTYVDEEFYCEDDELYCAADDTTMPSSSALGRESRPHHIPEDENAQWDEDLQAWVVRRAPRVRFSGD